MQKLMKSPLTFAVAMSIAATAQMPVAWSQDDDMALEEVMVTARKREENLQEVPLSVTAFSVSVLPVLQSISWPGRSSVSVAVSPAHSVTSSPSSKLGGYVQLPSSSLASAS